MAWSDRSAPDLAIYKISTFVTSALAQDALELPSFQKYTRASFMSNLMEKSEILFKSIRWRKGWGRLEYHMVY